jgi:hypothetical protein
VAGSLPFLTEGTLRRNYYPAETYVDNVVRRQDFVRDHPEFDITCTNYRWTARRHGAVVTDGTDLGAVLDVAERIAGEA